MNENIKVSVVIPVYNVERYISQCIESVISQSYKNMEIILVNDGSLDKSGNICDEYAQKDSRIIVIHKDNGGLSSARNAGIERATGEYITFLDSDDYWQISNGIEEIIEIIKQSEVDVVSWGYTKLYEKENYTKNVNITLSENNIHLLNKESSLSKMIESNCYIASAWNKMVKRSLFAENNLLFKIGMKSEDIDWCCRLAVYAQTFSIYNKNLLIYRQRGGSISQTLTSENIEHVLAGVDYCCDIIDGVNDEKLKNIYLSYVANQIFNLMVCISILSKTEQRKYISKVKKYDYILKSGGNKKIKI